MQRYGAHSSLDTHENKEIMSALLKAGLIRSAEEISKDMTELGCKMSDPSMKKEAECIQKELDVSLGKWAKARKDLVSARQTEADSMKEVKEKREIATKFLSSLKAPQDTLKEALAKVEDTRSATHGECPR